HSALFRRANPLKIGLDRDEPSTPTEEAQPTGWPLLSRPAGCEQPGPGRGANWDLSQFVPGYHASGGRIHVASSRNPVGQPAVGHGLPRPSGVWLHKSRRFLPEGITADSHRIRSPRDATVLLDEPSRVRLVLESGRLLAPCRAHDPGRVHRP